MHDRLFLCPSTVACGGDKGKHLLRFNSMGRRRGEGF